MHFDLLEEPWLPVVELDGSSTTVGLGEALTRAHELRWLEAEAPPVTAALYRLLLALAHRVYGPADEAEWATLWAGEVFSEEDLAAYSKRYADRFDLFDEYRPFLQCPQLPAEKMGTAFQLLPHRSTGNNATLFDHTTADEHPELDAAVAARWLVTLQAFDPGGLKTPYTKDKSSERGLCNYFATVLVEGTTLKETLLLNMLVYAPEVGQPSPTRVEDCPQWEAEQPLGPEPDKEGRSPLGWTDLLTWPSRRVLLTHVERDTGPKANGVVITPGTRLRTGTELADAELMAAFRCDVKKTSKGVFPTGPMRPVVLEELRGVWRHSRELLLPATERTNRSRVRPRVLDHVAEMVETGAVAEDHVYTLRVFGQQLGAQGGAVHTWLQESIPAPVTLLRADERDERIEPLLGYAVGLADDMGEALKDLEKRYYSKLGAVYDPRRSLLAQWYWPELSVPFGVVLRDLGQVLAEEPEGLFAVFARWKQTVSGLAREAAEKWALHVPRTHSRQLEALAEPYDFFQGRVNRLCKEFDANIDRFRDVDGDNDG